MTAPLYGDAASDLGGLCPLLANNGLPGHVAVTSALPPTADVRAAMSAFAPISSASPPGADSPGGVAEGPFLTLSGHSKGACSGEMSPLRGLKIASISARIAE